jgi:Ran GTPase-activating protein (RanGAP) involved in mRNA processing and transport
VDDEVLEGVASVAHLRHLRVHNTIERWPRDFHGYVSAAKKDCFTCLESLDLKVALDSEVRVLCAMCIISRCSRLRELSLMACNMDDNVAQDLAQILPELMSLEAVDVSDNAITITGAQSLAAALQGHPGIEILDLRGCMQTSCEAEDWERLGREYAFTNCDETYEHGICQWTLETAVASSVP